MTSHDALSGPIQGSLFPDGHEIVAEALAALRDLDVARGRKLVERARKQNPRLVNLAFIDQALRLLESQLGSGPPLPERLAAVVLAVRDESLAGRLPREAAEFVDQTIARYARRSGCPTGFLDEGQRVHHGVLDLVLGDAAAARDHLEATLTGGFDHRADLWGYMGDAALALERADIANACYVRGLLLSAADVDLVRSRRRDLVQIYRELLGTHAEEAARELLPVRGWLDGLLQIPQENGWLDGHLSRLDVRARVVPGSPPQQRWRRFAFLLYLDRSRPIGRVDLSQREEMAALDGDLFARYIRGCAESERIS